MRVVNGQAYWEYGDLVTFVDCAGGTAYRHVPYGRLRRFVATEYYEDEEWKEVVDYINDTWELGSDPFLNCDVIDDDTFEDSEYADYEQVEFRERARLWEVVCTQATTIDGTGTAFSLEPWHGDDASYSGYTVGSKVYDLPDGWCVEEDMFGIPRIWDDDGVRADIVSDNGRPCLVTRNGIIRL